MLSKTHSLDITRLYNSLILKYFEILKAKGSDNLQDPEVNIDFIQKLIFALILRLNFYLITVNGQKL